jgi:hypothetical protein
MAWKIGSGKGDVSLFWFHLITIAELHTFSETYIHGLRDNTVVPEWVAVLQLQCTCWEIFA